LADTFQTAFARFEIVVQPDVRSAFLLDVFSGELAVSKNLSKEASADGFSSVDGYNSTSTIGMLKESVAALFADNTKSESA
jgi:hypothetical protein